jgi:hypothetical protein
MKRLAAVLMCVVLATSGCATVAGGSRLSVSGAAGSDPRLMAAYVEKLPIGAVVRADLADGRSLRGSLMQVTQDAFIIQPRTRLPETPVEVPFSEVSRVSLEPSTSSIGRSIAIGAASGAAAALGVMLVLAAIFSGD